MERQFRSTDAKTRRSDHQQDDKGKDEGQGEGDRGEGNDGGRRGLVEDEVLDNIKCCVWSSTSDSSNASAPTSSSGVSLGNHLSSASESVAAAADAMLMQPWWGFPHFGCWLFSMDEEEGPCGVRSWWSVLFGCHGRHGNHYVITVPLEVHVVSVVPEEPVVLEVHVVPEVLLLVSPTFVAPLEARSLKMPSAPTRSIMPVVPEVLASPPASSRLYKKSFAIPAKRP